MVRYADYDVVFREIPDEVTLAVNLTGCPNGCPGCHSAYLQRDEGPELTESILEEWLLRYRGAITCLCFMGGDRHPHEVAALARCVRRLSVPSVRTAWYSGCSELPEGFDTAAFDYVKLGPYVERLGPLDSPSTNQRLYRIERTDKRPDGIGGFRMTDITSLMRRK